MPRNTKEGFPDLKSSPSEVAVSTEILSPGVNHGVKNLILLPVHQRQDKMDLEIMALGNNSGLIASGST